MTHTLSTNVSLSNLNTTLITDYTLITNLLVLTAMTFPVLTRSKNLLTEETVFFRLNVL